MRIVSLVPSWTETLVEAGLNVVGRTRFCIHPKKALAAIPAVGGTKDIDWEKVRQLNPDVVILDQEENPRVFAEQCPVRWIATHVTDLTSMQKELQNLAQELSSPQLQVWASETAALLKGPRPQFPNAPFAALEKIGEPVWPSNCRYLIWRNPWMSAEPGTFIGSVCEFVGTPLAPKGGTSRYPGLEDADLEGKTLLFSSEPYPFAKKIHELNAYQGWIVDGEAYSWFGVRVLRALQQA